MSLSAHQSLYLTLSTVSSNSSTVNLITKLHNLQIQKNKFWTPNEPITNLTKFRFNHLIEKPFTHTHELQYFLPFVWTCQKKKKFPALQYTFLTYQAISKLEASRMNSERNLKQLNKLIMHIGIYGIFFFFFFLISNIWKYLYEFKTLNAPFIFRANN
jgi:hypothetical protein